MGYDTFWIHCSTEWAWGNPSAMQVNVSCSTHLPCVGPNCLCVCAQGRVMHAQSQSMTRRAPSLSMTTGDRWAKQHFSVSLFTHLYCKSAVFVFRVLYLDNRAVKNLCRKILLKKTLWLSIPNLCDLVCLWQKQHHLHRDKWIRTIQQRKEIPFTAGFTASRIYYILTHYILTC